MKKRLFSGLLSAILLLSRLPGTALAADDPPAAPVGSGGHSDHCICGGNVTSGGHTTHDSSVTWTAWDGTGAINYGTSNTAYIYLTQNVTGGKALTVERGKTLYLCLNGKNIICNGSDGYAIRCEGSNLSICDCQGTGAIKTGSQRGIEVANSWASGSKVSSTCTLYSGTIVGRANNASGNKDSLSGVTVSSGCTFTMNGGTIKEHKVSGGGAGVHVVEGKFIMNAGTISENYDFAGQGGGGVDVFEGTFNMNGGTITQNVSKRDKTDNNEGKGGGVYIVRGTFTISGNAVIEGNTVVDYSGTPTTNNVYLENGQTITASGLTPGASIGVTTRTQPTEGNPVAITGSNSDDYSGCFTSDNSNYKIQNGTDDVVQLATIGHTTHVWDKYSAVTDNPAQIVCGCSTAGCTESGTLTLTAPTNCTYGGTAKPISLIESDWHGEPVGNISIIYQKRISTFWENMSDTPTQVGKYQASITVGGITAHVFYDITPAPSSIVTAPTAKTDLVYNGREQTLIDPGEAAVGKTLEYSLDGIHYDTALPTATGAGDYTVSYRVQGESTVQNIIVTLQKARLTGSPTFSQVTEAGKKLKDVTFTRPSTWPAGGFYWMNGEIGMDPETEITQGTQYEWVFIPDGTDYYSIGASSVLWATSSSGEGGSSGGGSSSGGSSSSGGGSSSGGSSSSKPTYAVNTSGNVSADMKKAAKGDVVKITVKPDAGYEVGQVLITDAKGNPVEVSANGNGTFSFVQPDSEVDIRVIFTRETAPFADVSLEDYFYDAVKWAKAQSVTGGVGGDRFGGDDPCTRAQIVTFLWRASGSPQPKGDSGFADVPADSYYAKAVAWAVEHGITQGTSADRFSPDAVCTRAQGITFLYRMAGSPAASGSAGFLDVADSDYFASPVLWAKEHQITGGVGNGLFGSADRCTRAQIVTFLFRAFGK